MAINSGIFISATKDNIFYSLDHVSYYQLEDGGRKVKVHFDNGDSKDFDGSDAQQFLTSAGRIPVRPSEAA